MFDYLALFQEYLTVELGLAKNTQLAYMRDLRLLMKSLQLKADEELLQVSRQQLIAYLENLKFTAGTTPALFRGYSLRLSRQLQYQY